MQVRPAPEWRTTTWLNSPEPLSLVRRRGRVVLLHAFQRLCPAASRVASRRRSAWLSCLLALL